MCPSRRVALRGLVGLAGGGMLMLPGCLEEDSNEDCPALPNEPDYAGWLDNTSNYRHTCDFRGEDLVVVSVGVRANQAYWGFRPPAVAVSPGTTVRWEWTGRGGPHDVEEDRSRFDSGRPVGNDTETFTVEFDDPGAFKYFCAPHRSAGMKGVVFVTVE